MTDVTYNSDLLRIRVDTGYPDKWLRRVECPCCSGPNLVPAFEHSGFSHSRCRACDFTCLDPYPTNEVMSRLYDGPYYTALRQIFETDLGKRRDRTPHTAPLDMLEDIVEQCAPATEGRWLDVGGGSGANAHFIRSKRPGWHVVVNEFSQLCRDLARELYSIEAVSDDAESLLNSGQFFDAISMIAVLEHIVDPLNFLTEYGRLLTDTGIIALHVPRFSRLNSAVSKGQSPAVTPPYHINLFHDSDLARLIERSGNLELIAIRQGGPKAFSLLHHVSSDEYWDTTIPNAHEPAPVSFKIKEYPLNLQIKLNALDIGDKAMESEFIDVDGRMLMTAYARRKK